MQNAALDPSQWANALDALNAFVGGSGVVLLSVAVRQKFAPMSTDMAGMMEDYFAGGWHANDRREACVPFLKRRGVVVDRDFQSDDEIENCDYYHDFLARHRQKWFAGVGVDVEGDQWCLALQRSPGLGRFGGSDDFAKLEILRGVLGNTAHLATQIGRSWMLGLQNALDLMEQAAVVFDTHARVLDINDAAVAILGASIGNDRQVRFDSAQATETFDSALKTALSPLIRTPENDPAQTIHLSSQSYVCRATSLLHNERLLGTRAAALMTLKPLVRNPAEIVKTRYGLTNTEAKVALALAGGKSVKEVALENRVKTETVRTQLKSIYNKTDVNTQSQLVAFMRDIASHDK